MLTRDQLATVRAALQYWQEEMCPHGSQVMRPYMDVPIEVPLSAEEVADLRSQLSDSAMRFVIYDPDTERMDSTKLNSSLEEAVSQATSPQIVATLLIPTVRT